MNRFSIENRPLAGVKCIKRKTLGDRRGFLSRIFCSTELEEAGWSLPISQINHTYTAQSGTVRGMHYQNPPHSEVKLVSCIRGRVWDVVVDLRFGSETFLNWHAEELSADNRHALLIPKGFAHGFQTLVDDTELLYCHSAAYNQHAETGVNPKDRRLAIEWPIEITEMSDRDKHHPLLGTLFVGLEL
jgi:dTDP-4-dehydrorhamnose 3,5-epimerase